MNTQYANVVFDCNVYITCAYLTGVPFSFTRLNAIHPKNASQMYRQQALLRGFIGFNNKLEYHVSWSTPIASTVRYKLEQVFDWTRKESNDFIHEIFTKLISPSGGITLSEVAEGWLRTTDYEDDIVYGTCIQLAREQPDIPVLFVTDDQELLHTSTRLQRTGSGPHRMVYPLSPYSFVTLSKN